MLDSKSIKKFWDAQAEKATKLSIESVANLEENTILLEQKIVLEKAKIIDKVQFIDDNSRVLDLGAGAGQWAFHFAKIAGKVTVVEYSHSMLKLAMQEGDRNGLANLEYIQSPAQSFITNDKYDLIWISGLLIYLSDEECQSLIKNCASMLKQNGIILLRDATGIQGHYEINNKYSDDLKAYYSANYRTIDEYLALFKNNGFQNIKHEDMFESNSILNKWKETRLRLYEFKKY